LTLLNERLNLVNELKSTMDDGRLFQNSRTDAKTFRINATFKKPELTMDGW